VPNLNLQPNTRRGTAKKIANSLYRKFVGATKNKKIKQATKSKTIVVRRMLFLVLQKDGRVDFAGIQLRLTLHQIRTLT
jgi:hypothetical protein